MSRKRKSIWDRLRGGFSSVNDIVNERAESKAVEEIHDLEQTVGDNNLDLDIGNFKSIPKPRESKRKFRL